MTARFSNYLAPTMPLSPTVGNAGGTRLLYNSENVQTRNDTGLDLSSVEGGGNRYDSVAGLVPEVGFDVFLHPEQDHGKDLLGGEQLCLRDLNVGPGIPVDDSEGPVLCVRLHLGVVEAATDEMLNAKDGVDRIYANLVPGIVSNEMLGLFGGDIRGDCAAAPGVGNNFGRKDVSGRKRGEGTSANGG
ncbi:NAD-specific glutamate dehydrogenase-domain-containing protein [Jimgerdemannia flammicorona]|uniref:NAD-specific glutamate dehydrogenase-domain-containing protein n=1 Tax=Jimgerdemannia flammicorona TaxID=994334 RepID=A0A433D1Y0_9FUNG|nr:NAD-specific glutamate dehydrogenase-domain-containing protein [Jimgerdemannia flammicorona]